MSSVHQIKRLAFLFLILPAMLLQVWNTSLVYFWYYSNQNSITQKYCININKPELKCNGRCHINEVLDKTLSLKDDWKPLATYSIEDRNYDLTEDSNEIKPFFFNQKEKRQPYFFYHFNYSFSFYDSHFQPPRSCG